MTDPSIAILATDEEGNPIAKGGTTLTLSPSTLSDYEICGRRGQYHSDPDIPPGSPTWQMLRGTAWHRGLEAWHNERLAHGLDALLAFYDEVGRAGLIGTAQGEVMENAMGLLPPEEVILIGESLQAMNKTWQEGDPQLRWEVPHIELVNYEVPLFVDRGTWHDDVAFIGYADAIFRLPHVEGVIGVDFKGATKAWGGAKAEGDPRKLIQAPLYAEAWEEQNDEPMNHFAYDVMTQAGKFQRVWVDVRPEVRVPFLNRWKETADQIINNMENGLSFPTNPGHILCNAKWCGFWSICPMGDPLDQVLQIGAKP